jgi:hypothetical protein
MQFSLLGLESTRYDCISLNRLVFLIRTHGPVNMVRLGIGIIKWYGMTIQLFMKKFSFRLC